MKKHYPSTTSEIDFTKVEEEILQYWQQHNTFQASVDKVSSGEFIFYDGPPFANGLPHYGHLLTGFIKDTIARCQTMSGQKVARRFGWDCHGLPAEMGAEKELGISGRLAIEKFGIDNFNEVCRQSVMKFSSEWEKYVTRQARWVDFHNDYKTMDTSFMESVMWAFKTLYDKGLVYESKRVMPYSWACETPLSNFETKMDNAYRQKTSKAVTVAFTLRDKVKGKKCKILAWTTTPWTLPSNLILAVGKTLKYGAILMENDEYYIASYSYLQKTYPDVEIMELGPSDLLGQSYQPLFNCFADNPNSFKILAADFVVEGEGTGIVHVAPGFGEDDFALCQAHDIPIVCPVDNAGNFTSEVTEFVGQQVFAANDEIIKLLKQQGSWLKTEQYLHNYPHCWRTDTPLIYKAISSWYVEVTAFKDRMVELNQEINWVPGHIRDGQFGRWLEGARDWSISRNRFWGTPIPVWRSDDPQYPRIDVYGSIADLEKDFNVKVTDLHRPFIDQLVRPNPDDPTGQSMMRRVPDVLDCWFESGSMPYAQAHYPFENKELFEKNFPADFITEYVAQTRGWFYTLMVLSTAIFDRPPFKNCICHGVVLDTQGQKLSKRLNNYADPTDIFNKYGADALRFLMLSSPIVNGGDLLLDKEGNMMRDTLRLVIKPIWNAYHFFCLYANADALKAEYNLSSTNDLDQYIIAKCYQALTIIKQAFDNYDTMTASKGLMQFFDALNNWYIRRSRSRFWQDTHNDDKQAAYNTLYVVLSLICRAGAPLLPLLMEKIWLGFGNNDSVHLQDFPQVQQYDSTLIEKMDRVRDICNAALSLRNACNIRIRQPLSCLTIYRGEKYVDEVDNATKSLIKDELNIKDILFYQDVNTIADFKLKLNFPVLGKRLPNNVKEIMSLVKRGHWQQNDDQQLQVGDFLLQSQEYELTLQPHSKDAQVVDDMVILLDTNITPELEIEGIARDIVRFIQQTRKEANLNITDKINLTISTSDEQYKKAVLAWEEYIKQETLSNRVDIADADNCQFQSQPSSVLTIGIDLI